MTIARRCLGTLIATLVVLAGPAAGLSLAEACNKRTKACEVSDQVVDTGNGTSIQRKKTGPPPCSAIAKGVPDDGRPVPKGWVRTSCLEGSLTILYWVPPREGANPELIARNLVDRMQLQPISIGLTPLGEDPIALVGLPVWLWVDGPDRLSWGPATISAGGVTLTARVESVLWEMGDRDRTWFECGKGTVWRRFDGGEPSPTCGFTYLDHGTYTVRATSRWVARWSGHGRSGVIRLSASTSQQLRVGEIQVIVSRGP